MTSTARRVLLRSRTRVYKRACIPHVLLLILVSWKSATSPSSPTSTMARPRWSTSCSNSPARCARTSTCRARHGLQRPGARARHHHPGQVHLGGMAAACASTSSTRPATPTSAAKWSASSSHGRRRGAAGRRRGRRHAADQVRARQGAEARPASPSWCSTRSTAPTPSPRKRWNHLRPVPGAGRQRRSARLPLTSTPAAARLGGERTGGRAQEPRAAVRADRRRRAAAQAAGAGGRRASLQDAGDHAGSRSISWAACSPAASNPASSPPTAYQGADPRRQGHREGPRHQAAGLPRPGARAGGASRSRRHRRHRRP